jgi:uroporphyrinogen-III synthase
VSLRVALTRPIEAARRSAPLLQVRGFEPIFAPATEIFATGAGLPDDDFDGLLATSANAFVFLPAGAAARLRGLKLYVAGERTAAAAGAAGFGAPEAVSAEASTLAASLAARLPPCSRLLYLTARDRKSGLEATLRAAGHQVFPVEIYVAEARRAWSAAEAEAFSSCGAALHYSRRSAELALVLADRAGLGDHLRAILHGCISRDAAEPLRSTGAKRIVVAASAQESLLLDALGSAAKTS